jgi:hypothetical protein
MQRTGQHGCLQREATGRKKDSVCYFGERRGRTQQKRSGKQKWLTASWRCRKVKVEV